MQPESEIKKMIADKVEGRQVRYWDFEKTEQKDGSAVASPGFVTKDSEVAVQLPENVQEALELARGDEKRLCELIAKGIKAEAEDKAGETPAGTFSQSMISNLDKAFKSLPQFAGIKSSKDRREAEMKWISAMSPEDRAGYVKMWDAFRNVKNRDAEDSE